jgi:hypothetical protein
MENRYYHSNNKNQNKGLPIHSHHHRSHHLPPRPSIDVTVIEPVKSPKNLNLNSNTQFPISTVSVASSQSNSIVEMPATPCPSSAEYMTPVFARNHEGAWRYVVQIPKEGYFTQTVEVTKCLKSNCYYMEGECKTSPRWQSLLVAELYYPDAIFPTTSKPNFNGNTDFDRSQNNDVYSGGSNTSSSSVNNKRKTDPTECDGFDAVGCYTVRLFYDWLD